MKTIASLMLFTSTMIVACGGGGSQVAGIDGGGTPNPVATAVVSNGTITNFGSVVVNGVHYDTNGAAISIDGQPAIQSDLSVGQVVTVQGTIDTNLTTGIASSVTFDDVVQGPISSIDIALSQIVVLEQLVRISPETSFDDSLSPSSIDGLAVGMIVEVSGLIAADGSVQATRIEPKPAGTQFEVHGTVTNLDSGNSRFSINNLVVDFSGALLDDFPGGDIDENDFVEAKGMSFGPAGELVATKVEFENGAITGEVGLRVEIEGFITRFVSATDFDVAGTPVTTTTTTTFEGGAAVDLGLNIKVEVEGNLDANNVIVAQEVDIRRSKVVRATAIVDSVSPANNSLVMLGVTFAVDALTRMEDKSNADVSPFTIDDINAGDYLEIRGGEFPADSGQILATILEREDLDNRTILQGFVVSVNDPSLTILGVTIETNGGTIFRDVDDSILTPAEFFNLVDVNSIIKARGVETGDTTITATEVEFELEI